jgi:hypothetical protein
VSDGVGGELSDKAIPLAPLLPVGRRPLDSPPPANAQ